MKKIPNLKGLSVEEAKDLLRQKSIKFIDEPKKIFSLTVGNGKIVKAEEENKKVVLYESNRKLFLFIILGTITVTMALALSITYGNGIYKSIKDQIIEITGQITAPELEAEPGWGKERIVKVKKDAKGSKEIKFYEYCVRKNQTDECDWKETYTKNTVISKTGTWYVTFRGVDKDGKRGKEATVIVYVDNEAPDIKEFKVEKEEETSITVKTISEDKDSGLDKIMYSLDGINYIDGKEEYTFNNLVPGYEYTLYVKAVDKAGNEKVLSMKLQKKPQEETEEANNPSGEEIENKEKEWDTPQIDLKKLPSVFEYGEKYNLPSRYDFGNDEGIVVCKVDGIEEKDTKNLTVGKHEVKCTATSNHKKEAQVEKEILVQAPVGEDELFDGWIKLNLYYPENSYNWQWRYGIKESDTEEYEEIGWEDYTGPILVKVEDINKIYIRYDQKGEPQIIAPSGQVLVNIEPAKKQVACGGETQVSILFDQEALTKQYRINGGKWQDYQGPFPANGNTLIEARTTKNEDVYNTDGELEYTKLLEGYDKREVKEEQCKEVQDPAINLNGIPSIVYMGENISLPTYYTYGSHEAGKVECTDQNGNKVVNTRFLTEGNYKVTCNLETADGIKKGPVSRSFTIERREQAPEVSLWELPSRIVKGDSYKLPSYYTYGSHGTGTIICQDELSNVITNTSELELGDHTVTCILTAEDGKQAVDSRNIKVSIGFEPYIDLNHLQSTIYKGDFYSLPGTYDYGRPNSGIKECRVNGEVLTDTHSLDIGTYDILCSITNLAGQNATASRTINVVKRPIVPEPIYDPLKGPVITADPNNNTISEEVEVTITPEEEASVIKYSYDLHNWYTYKEPFMLYENKMIYAYYIRKSDGKQSDISEYYVQNIKERNLPYVRIDANPGYEVTEGTNVEVTISGSDYDTLEYSYDGVVYYPYTGPLTITQSKTVYAKGTNRYGSTKESVTIKTTKPPVIPEKLSIAIALNPNGTQGYIVNETEVIINYDSKAEHKYYKTSSSAEWQEYTGPFKVRQNTTVYAYATSKNGQGNAEKSIDFLVLGISDPIISIDKKPPLRAHSVKVHITWDKNAVVKKYRIKNEDGTVTDWKDWEDDIEIDENCTVEAYQEDSIGNTSKPVEYKITNIVPEPSYTSVAKGDYYLIKLNYPSTSGTNSREYKWKDNGNWKKYNQKGILLIKQDKVDNYNLKADGVEIEDENGNKVTIDIAHVYVLDVPLSEMSENLFMRWDNTKPASPTINFNTENVTTEVEVSISYAKVIVEKEYKIVYSDGTDSGWQEYTGPFKVNKNNTTIQARGKNRLEIYSETVDRTITNIDEVAPTITLTGDLKTPKQVVNLTVTGNDDKMLYMVKWARGKKNTDYFNENKDDQGTSIKNGSTIQLEENGNYTFYAVDQAGNETIKQIKITNVDKEAPELSVNVLTPGGNNSLIDVEIDYGDSVTKYYKIGDTETWTAYTDVLQLRTMEVYQLKNDDGSLTLSAKGVDEAGNETIISEKIYALDLNVPAKPIIDASGTEYPTLTEYGWKLIGNTTITYDTSRNDLINTYSTDGGETWHVYTGPFEFETSTGTIKAKSEVSGNKNIYADTTKTLNGLASDALPDKAYDNNYSTSISLQDKVYYANISSGAVGSKIIITPDNSNSAYQFLDANNQYLASDYTTNASYSSGAYRMNSASNMILEVPKGAVKLKAYGVANTGFMLIDIQPYTTPIAKAEYIYPTISLYGWEQAYNKVTIDYPTSAVQKFYKIDDGEWQSYRKPINVPTNSKLYAYSIDKNNTVLPTLTYTSQNKNDKIPSQVYDNNTSTYTVVPPGTTYVAGVANDIAGYNIKITVVGANTYYQFLDSNNNSLESNYSERASYSNGLYRPINGDYMVLEVPDGTQKIRITNGGNNGFTLNEIQPHNAPAIKKGYVYPTLTADGWQSPYNTVTITYFATSVQKLYKIDNGEWLDYTKPIQVKVGSTITAYGIDKNGKSSVASTYTSTNNNDALPDKAYDNNYSTSISLQDKVYYAAIGEDIAGFNIIITPDAANSAYQFLDENNAYLESNYTVNANYSNGAYRKSSGSNMVLEVPSNTKKIKVYGVANSGFMLTDIQLNSAPKIESSFVYSKITGEGIDRTGYNEVTINYLQSLKKKKYKIDDGEWLDYTKPIKLYTNATISAKGIYESGNESQTSIESISIPADGLESFAYDNDISTYSNGGKLLIDSSAINKLINLDFESTSSISIKYYDETGSLITDDSREGTKREIDVFIPSGASYVIFSGTDLRIYEMKINKLNAISTPQVNITNEGQYETSKTVTIVYPDGEYLNEYSLDEGTTWNTYTDPFTIDDATLIYARSTEDGRYISSSTYYAHNVYTTVTLDAGEFGTLDNTTLNLVAGESYGNLPTPAREGCTFIGWFYDQLFSERLDDIVRKGDHTIYAKIIDKPSIGQNISYLKASGNTDLVIDTTQDASIRYNGADPNNYIYFNCQDYTNQTDATCEKWRIVGLINNLTNSKGETLSAVKLIYPASVGNRFGNGLQMIKSWGSSNVRNYLNSTYYNNLKGDTKYYILNVKTNYNNVTSFSTALNVYNQERNGSTTSDDYVSLLYPSDYGFASSESCWSTNMNAYASCRSWVSSTLDKYKEIGGATPGGAYFVSPYNSGTTTMYYKGYLNHASNTGGFSNGNNETLGTFPTVYISANNVIASGEGSSSDPYQLESK